MMQIDFFVVYFFRHSNNVVPKLYCEKDRTVSVNKQNETTETYIAILDDDVMISHLPIIIIIIVKCGV